MTTKTIDVDAELKISREVITCLKRCLWLSVFALLVVVGMWATALPADRRGASHVMMLALGVNCECLLTLWLVKHKARKLKPAVSARG